MVDRKTLKKRKYSKVKASFSRDKNRFFFIGSLRGFIIGPRDKELKSGNDDHLTIGMNQNGNIHQIHRTIDGKKAWWRTSESLQEDLQNFWISHSKKIDTIDLTQPNSYIISWNRLFIGINIIASFISFFTGLLRRKIEKIEANQLKNNTIRIEAGIDKPRAIHLINSLRLPLSLAITPIVIIPNYVWTKILKRILKIFLINPSDHHRLSHDLGIVISPKKMGLIRSKGNQLSFISYQDIQELFSKVEKELPLGKLSNIMNLSSEKVIMDLTTDND